MPENVNPGEYPQYSFFKNFPPHKQVEIADSIGSYLGYPPFYEENGGKPLYAYKYLEKCEDFFTSFLANSKEADEVIEDDLKQPSPSD